MPLAVIIQPFAMPEPGDDLLEVPFIPVNLASPRRSYAAILGITVQP